MEIMTSRANNIGTELNDDNLNAVVCKPGFACTESYLLIGVGMELDEVMCKIYHCICIQSLHAFVIALRKRAKMLQQRLIDLSLFKIFPRCGQTKNFMRNTV